MEVEVESAPSSPQKVTDRHECICTSEKCSTTRDLLNETDDVRGGPPLRLTHSTDPKCQCFWHRLCMNLKPTEATKREMESKGARNRFSMCRHHCTAEFLKEKAGGACETLLKKEEASRLLCELDPADCVMGEGCIKSPSASMDALLNELTSSGADRSSRALAREEAIASNRLTEDWQKLESELRGTMSKKNEQHDRDVSVHEDDVAQHQRDAARIQALECQNSKLKREHVKDQKEISDLKKEMVTMTACEELIGFMQAHGGLGRITIFNDEWHEQHKDAAHLLWGFRSHGETKQCVSDSFVDVVPAPVGAKVPHSGNSPAKLELAQLLPFEKCLLARLLFRRELPQGFIALTFGKHRTHVGGILREWAPRWGKAGEQLSIVDATEECLDAEEPDRSQRVGVKKVVNVDGTDTNEVDEKRSNLTANRATFGTKNDNHSARGLTWSAAGGLSFEHTPLFGARVSEKSLHQHWGSLGEECAPLEEWKDVAVGVSNVAKCLRLELPTEDALDCHDIEELVKTMSVLSSTIGGVGDDVLATARPGGVSRMAGVSATATDESDGAGGGDDGGGNGGGRRVKVGDIDEWFKELCAMKSVSQTTGKSLPLLSSETLKDQNDKALRGGVNSSGLEKLCQLEVHEHLHQSHQAKRLKKNALSHHLLVSAGWRHLILKWLGSDLAPASVECPSVEDLPKIWLRLAKVPRSHGMLGDKGFDKTTRFDPRLNKVRTPWLLARVKDHRQSPQMIKQDHETSDTRTIAEADFSRCKSEEVLKETVPHWAIAMLPYAHEWGHAWVNLLKPFRKPGPRNSAVSDSHWKS